MELFVNELSLDGQFSTLPQFLASLKEVLRCRDLANRYRHPFYCPRALGQRPAIPNASFKQAVAHTGNTNVIRTVMSWIDKHGPFWDETRMHYPDEWFEYAGEIVTDHSL